MLDHIGIGVKDYANAKAFYIDVLAPLGAQLLTEIEGAEIAGFGRDGIPTFWINAVGQTKPPLHIAIGTAARAEVDAFYKTAIAAGARDNGAPGLRPDYGPNYYAAYVIDPDGHNLEAVSHAAG